MDPAVPDRLVQLGGLRERGDAQLSLQEGDQRSVLADSAGPISGPCKELDQPSLGWLVERIELHLAPNGDHRGGKIAMRLGQRRQLLEHGSHGALRGNSACGPPVIELWAVAKGEAGQERSAGGAGGRLQPGQIAGVGRILEQPEIHVRAAGEDNRASISGQPATAQGGAEHGQRATERPSGGLVIGFRPQHRGQLIAGERPCLDREQDKDRECLAGINHDRPPIGDHLERTKDPDRQSRGVRCGVRPCSGGHSVATVPRQYAIS